MSRKDHSRHSKHSDKETDEEELDYVSAQLSVKVIRSN